MKNYFVYGFVILGLVATTIFMRMGRPGSDADTVARVQEAPPDQMAPNAEVAPLDRTRLAKVADANYKGPSYKENYDTPEVRMAAKMRANGRLPAAAEGTAQEPEKK